MKNGNLNTPGSLVERMAWFKFEQFFAWSIRGGGYIDTVKEDDYITFIEHLKRLDAELDEATELRAVESAWHGTKISVQKALGCDRGYLMEIALEGLSIDPNGVWLLSSIGNALLPRWGARPDEFKAFADLAAPEYGEHIYALMITQNIIYINCAERIVSRRRVSNGRLGGRPTQF